MTNSDQIKEAEIEDYDIEDAAIKDAEDALANAFAAIEEHRDYIPARVYNGMTDYLQEFYYLSEWQCDPEVLREVLPAILRAAIKKSKEEE